VGHLHPVTSGRVLQVSGESGLFGVERCILTVSGLSGVSPFECRNRLGRGGEGGRLGLFFRTRGVSVYSV
jgi:hypothetical protein